MRRGPEDGFSQPRGAPSQLHSLASRCARCTRWRTRDGRRKQAATAARRSAAGAGQGKQEAVAGKAWRQRRSGQQVMDARVDGKERKERVNAREERREERMSEWVRKSSAQILVSLGSCPRLPSPRDASDTRTHTERTESSSLSHTLNLLLNPRGGSICSCNHGNHQDAADQRVCS